MSSAPRPTNAHSTMTSDPLGAKANKRAKPTATLRNPHRTLTTGEDSPTRWGGERSLKRVAADSLNEMRDAVGQKQSGDELQQVDIPGKSKHRGRLPYSEARTPEDAGSVPAVQRAIMRARLGPIRITISNRPICIAMTKGMSTGDDAAMIATASAPPGLVAR